MAAMLNHLVTTRNAGLPSVGGTGNGATKGLDERHFRRIQKFDNIAEAWKEWLTPVTATVMETLETSEVPVQPEKVLETDPSYQEALGLQYSLHSRLVSLTTGVSFAIVESSGSYGLEAWRLLTQKYNPRTHAGCVQMLRRIGTFSIPKVEDVLTGIVRWESMVAILARGHKEVLSDKMRMALLISILPTSRQECIMEHLDRLTTYNEVHDKVVSVVQACPRYSASDAMDCSGLDYYEGYTEDYTEEADIDAISRDHCARCGGFGHYARDCTTPKGKGKEKGK